MEKTVKIFFACAAGAGIGSVVALQFITQLWWLGMLVGGLAGYVLYDLKEIAWAVKKAWLQTANDFVGKAIRGLKTFGCLAAGTFSFTLTGLSGTALVFWLLGGYDVPAELNFTKITFSVAFVWVMFLVPAYFAFLMTGACFTAKNNRIAMDFGLFLVRGNPFSFYFYWLPKGTFWFLRRLPGWLAIIWKTVWKFTKTVFILIHSNERLLCMIDAAIGVAVFHFTGNNIFLGMLAGGVLGIINYEISVRLLKLSPL